MAGFPQTVLTMAFVLIPIGCLTNWASSFIQLRNDGAMLPYTKRDCVSWGLLDLGLFIILLGTIVGGGVSFVASSQGIGDTSDLTRLTPQEQSFIFVAFGTATITATALGIVWMFARFQKCDGLVNENWASDIRLGVRWFMMLIVPVVLIQLLLNQWFPTKHPLIEMMRRSRDTSLLPVAAFAAVVAAPFFEEILFRLFLQGWLEKMQISRQRTVFGLSSRADRSTVLTGGALPDDLYPDAPVELPDSPMLTAFDKVAVAPPTSPPRADGLPTSHDENPYSPPGATEQPLAIRGTTRPTMWGPILISSILFSLAHLGHGPDWVPLLFLAVGLGYLYQRTGRILPSIIVHVLVNALGILQLWVAVTQ